MVRPDSAGRPDFTRSVPTELLLDVLSGFTFEELLPLLAVDGRWRAVALDSKAYWSFIRLDSLRAGSASLFVTRLSRTKERPVGINVDIRIGVEDVPASQAMILSALRAHLHHAHWLLVTFRGSDASGLWNALNFAAPRLRHVGLQADLPPNGDPPIVPVNIFAGDAPSLRSVTLVDIDLPAQPLPVFSNVTTFNTDSGAIRAVPDVFDHFPALENIEFPSNGTFEHPAFHTARSYAKLKTCVWRSGGRSDTVLLPLAPACGVHFLTIYHPRAAEMQMILEPLLAPLELNFLPSIEYPDAQFELEIIELGGPRRRGRVIIDNTGFWSENLAPDLKPALSTALAGKIHTLSVDAENWDSFARCLPALPELKGLRIKVANESDIAVLTHTDFPSRACRTLELTAPQCMVIAEHDISDFAAAVFDTAALRETTLVLVNIHLRCRGPHRIGGMFKKTRVVHDVPCLLPRRPLPAQVSDKP